MHKQQRIEAMGYPVVVLWKDREKGISSTRIRQAIDRHEEWENEVPAATYRYIVGHGIDERIRRLLHSRSSKFFIGLNAQ